MCQITLPTQAPVEGQQYSFTISGTTPLDWSWDIEGVASDSGSSSETPSTVTMQVPNDTTGKTLHIHLQCQFGEANKNVTIQSPSLHPVP